MFTITRFQVKMSKKLLVSAFIGGFATIGALAWAAQSVVFVQPTGGTPIPWPLDGSNIPKVDCVTGCGGGGGAGTVTEVDTSGGVTGGPITTTGTVTLTNLAATSHQWLDSVVTGSFHKSQPAFTDISGTAAVTQGGTGATTLGANGVVLGEGSAAVHVTSAGTAGDVLTSNGAGVDPTFQAASGGLPSGGVTGQVLNAVTSSPAVWGSVVIGPDAIGGSGGNGANATIQSGAGDGAGTDGNVILNPRCNTNCGFVQIGDISDPLSSAIIVSANAIASTNGDGLPLYISSGSGDGTGNAGQITITGGSGGTSGRGGALNLYAGTTGTGNGSSVNVSGSDAGSSGSGGFISLVSGNGGSVTGPGGDFSIRAGAAASGDSNGGVISVTAGNGSGTGTGGTLSFASGDASGVGGAGGDIHLGAGVGNSANSGGIVIESGHGSDVAGNNGGTAVFESGRGGVGGGNGGAVSVTSGPAPDSGNGGELDVSTGTGVVGGLLALTAAGGTTTGGDIHVFTGNGAAGNGGNFILQAGGGSAGNNGGDVHFVAGAGNTGHDGFILFGSPNAVHEVFTTAMAPTPVLSTGAGDCGTTPTIDGNDSVARIQVGSGANGGKCTVTFQQAWNVAPICSVQDETTAVLVRPVVTQTTLAITGVIVAADLLSYHCVAYE